MKVRSIVIPVVVLTIAILLLLTITGRWNTWASSSRLQETDDAYVHANIASLSTKVSGNLRALNVSDYQRVQAGQVLAQIDDRDYRASLAQAQAALEGAQASLADNQAEKQVQRAKIAAAQSDIVKANAGVESARATIASAQADALRTEQERQRQQALFAQRAATKQDLEKAVADANRYLGLLDGDRADLAKAQAAVAGSLQALAGDERSLAAMDVKDMGLRADIDSKRAAIASAQAALDYTAIIAPVDGEVGERKVFPGQLVTPGEEVITLVEGRPWVQANYRETQLGGIRVGDRADVTIDAMPGVRLHGHVAEISPASGSQNALLPPDNATGNFTKVVQRIPVKVELESDDADLYRLRPGFSAVVSIHASGVKAATDQ